MNTRKKKTPVMTSDVGLPPAPTPKMPDMFVPHMLRKMKTPKPTDALFRTDVDPAALWGAYLNNLPPELRQEHNCRCCRQFIERYGNLVTIDPKTGKTTSAFWGSALGDYAVSTSHMRHLVDGAAVTGVFRSRERVLGTPHNKAGNGATWSHLSATVTATEASLKYTDEQLEAFKLEEYGMLRRGLDAFRLSTFASAESMLRLGALDRAEKHADLASWLLELKTMITSHKDVRVANNLLWLAVDKAPEGWCHVSSGMIGTLLEDIEQGKSQDVIVSRYNAKMHPLKYLRPTAAPKQGTIDAAEKLFEKMGLARSLERRVATYSDIQEWLWQPPVEKRSKKTKANTMTPGLFGHIAPKAKPEGAPAHVPGTTKQVMSWHKFARDIMPNALSMEYVLARHDNYATLAVAVHPDAPPVFQWDRPERRNTVSHYVYAGGSPTSKWFFDNRRDVATVAGVTYKPHMWNGTALPNQSVEVILVLKECRELTGGTTAFFPECMRSGLHEVRSVLEKYREPLKSVPDDSQVAAGVLVGSGSGKFTLRVTLKGGVTTEVTIDRWE